VGVARQALPVEIEPKGLPVAQAQSSKDAQTRQQPRLRRGEAYFFKRDNAVIVKNQAIHKRLIIAQAGAAGTGEG
jgi:hypothetical protein